MDEDDKEKQTTAAYPSEMLYVVESIVLNKCESLGSSDPLKPVLVPGKSKKANAIEQTVHVYWHVSVISTDPVDIHTYYVVHIDGVYIVTLSWLSKLDMFTAADCKYLPHIQSGLPTFFNVHVHGGF